MRETSWQFLTSDPYFNHCMNWAILKKNTQSTRRKLSKIKVLILPLWFLLLWYIILLYCYIYYSYGLQLWLLGYHRALQFYNKIGKKVCKKYCFMETILQVEKMICPICDIALNTYFFYKGLFLCTKNAFLKSSTSWTLT